MGEWLRRRCEDRPASQRGGSVISWQNWWPVELKCQSGGGWPKKKKHKCTTTSIRPEMRLSKKTNWIRGPHLMWEIVQWRAKREGRASHEQRLSLFSCARSASCCVTPCHVHVLCTWIWRVEWYSRKYLFDARMRGHAYGYMALGCSVTNNKAGACVGPVFYTQMTKLTPFKPTYH